MRRLHYTWCTKLTRVASKLRKWLEENHHSVFAGIVGLLLVLISVVGGRSEPPVRNGNGRRDEPVAEEPVPVAVSDVDVNVLKQAAAATVARQAAKPPQKPSAETPKPPPKPPAAPSVSWIQGRLRAWGYTVSVDGVMGAETRSCISLFQRSQGLAADGIAGPATVAKLAGTPVIKVPPLGQQIASYARQFAGIRYVWGGNYPSTGFDCSGYTRYVYAHYGKAIPRVASDQHRSFRSISRSQLQPGDLIFFHNKLGYVFHVAMYIGGNQMIEANSPSVHIDSMPGGYVTYGTILH